MVQAMRKHQEDKKQTCEACSSRPSRSTKSTVTVGSRLQSMVLQMTEKAPPGAVSRLTLFQHQSPVHEIVSTRMDDFSKEASSLHEYKAAFLALMERHYDARRLGCPAG